MYNFGDYLNSNELNCNTIPYLESVLQEQFIDPSVEKAMERARIWVRQCLVMDELIAFEAIESKYLTMTWDNLSVANMLLNLQSMIAAPVRNVLIRPTVVK